MPAATPDDIGRLRHDIKQEIKGVSDEITTKMENNFQQMIYFIGNLNLTNQPLDATKQRNIRYWEEDIRTKVVPRVGYPSLSLLSGNLET